MTQVVFYPRTEVTHNLKSRVGTRRMSVSVTDADLSRLDVMREVIQTRAGHPVTRSEVVRAAIDLALQTPFHVLKGGQIQEIVDNPENAFVIK